MTKSRSMSMRMAAAAGSLALAATAFAAPAAFAADSPEGAVDCLVTNMEAKDFESMADCFCDAQASQLGGLNLQEQMTAGLGDLDPQEALDAFEFDVEITQLTETSATDDEVVFDMTGQMTVDINPDAAGPFIAAVLEASGQEVTDDLVEMMTGMMASQFAAEPQDISSEVVVARDADGSWGVCSDLTGGGMTDDESGDDMGGMDDSSAGDDPSAAPDGAEGMEAEE